jgi:hypothetical protein
VFENRVLRRIFGSKRDKVTEVGENCIMRSFKSRRMRCSTNGGEEECI